MLHNLLKESHTLLRLSRFRNGIDNCTIQYGFQEPYNSKLLSRLRDGKNEQYSSVGLFRHRHNINEPYNSIRLSRAKHDINEPQDSK